MRVVEPPHVYGRNMKPVDLGASPFTVGGSDILPDGDPQAGYPTILVLASPESNARLDLIPLPSLTGEVYGTHLNDVLRAAGGI